MIDAESYESTRIRQDLARPVAHRARLLLTPQGANEPAR